MSALSVSTRSDIHARAPIDCRTYTRAAHSVLKADIANALLRGDVHRDIATPMCVPNHREAHAAVYELLCEPKGGDELLCSMLTYIGERAKQGDVSALMVLSLISEAHAQVHAHDLARLMEGEEE